MIITKGKPTTDTKQFSVSKEICDCGRCIPDPMFTMKCARTGKFLSEQYGT